MSNHPLLVGASVPTGVQALQDFENLKLGELVLMTLPDEAAEAFATVRYCREHHIYFMLSELVHRGGDERWHCPSLDKDTFDAIVAEAGEFYLGRYTIGEAGGIMYWPKEYTLKRAVKNYTNLPPADNVIDARQKYIDYLKPYIDRERSQIGNGRLLNVDSSMLFKYQAESGIDDLGLELLPGDPHRMLPAIRGCARMLDKFWGVHIAFGWYGGFETDALWLNRWRQTLYLSYLSGAEFIFPESGYYGMPDFPFHADIIKQARLVLREFYRFHKIHKRPGNSPRTRLALAFGQFDGCPGLWNPYAWGQYENGEEWKDTDAERSWDFTNVLIRRENPYSELLIGSNSFSGNPPDGQYDILPAEAPVEILSQYRDLVFLGYNLMDGDLYQRLVSFVRNGGHLLMFLPHLNVDPKRGAAVKLFNNGDLTELFGVKITGQREPEVLGLKPLGKGELPLPFRGLQRDPMMMGNMATAKLELSSPNATITAAFTGKNTLPMEELLERPALVEHKLGKGIARLVPVFEYPAAPGLRPWAEHILRCISLDAQDEIRLVSADSVRYAVYDATACQILYALNTEFDVSQNVRVFWKGKLSREFAVAPSSMGVFFLRDGVLLKGDLQETAVESWMQYGNANTVSLFSLEAQVITADNLTDSEIQLTLNGQEYHIAPQGRCICQIARRTQPGLEQFYNPDFLQEPWLDIKDTSLPY